MNGRARLLVIEDDPRLQELLRQELSAAGHDVLVAGTGADGLITALDEPVDLVLLDLNLPDVDGIEVAERLRADHDVPILMLTARADVTSRVDGLYAGAADYVTKPFELRELLARVHVRLRERQNGDEVRHGPVTLHLPSSSVRCGERSAVLAERELEILRLLLSHPGQLFSRDDLERRLYGADVPASNTVEVFVYQLRRKLAGLGVTDLIRTVRTKGYMVT
jgi:DNA-binding response OmpR family regulator